MREQYLDGVKGNVEEVIGKEEWGGRDPVQTVMS